MKRISMLLVLLTSVVVMVAQQGRDLVIYNGNTVISQIPVGSIDSMKFYDPQNYNDFEVLFKAPETIMDVLVQYDLAGTSHDSFGFMAILLATDLMSEDIVMSKLSHFRYDYAHDNIRYNYRRTNMIWRYFSKVIEISNKVIKNAPSTSGDQRYRMALGTAYAMRAFSHFYLMQLYQFTGFYDMPQHLQLPTIAYSFADNEALYNQRSYRVSAADLMQLCEQDYLKAKQQLAGVARTSKNYLNTNVVEGLLARLYLLKGDWLKAATAAAAARSGFQLMSSGDLFDGFMRIYNPEWMWGYEHNVETSTIYASYFSHISNSSVGYAGIDYAPKLIDKRLYERIPVTDSRKQWFQNATGSLPASPYTSQEATTWRLPYANLKFGWEEGFAQDYMYMRAAEMYLIETEALIRLGQSTNALTVYNQYYPTRHQGAQAQSVTLEDVLLQRRIELWGEGFAYFDLKRLNRGIDRTYAGNNHEPSCILAVPAGDSRWNFELPPIAFDQFPGMIDLSQMPDLSNNQLLAATGKTLSLVCYPANMNEAGSAGVVISTDPGFNANTRTVEGVFTQPGVRFDVLVNGLAPLTTYYVKYYFRSAKGIVYSPVKSAATTALVLPTVSMQTGTIGSTSISVGGNYQFGSQSSRVISVVIQASKVPGFNSEIWQVNGQLSGADFTATLNGLSPSTQYYLRAVVECEDGIAYSPVIQAVTLDTSLDLSSICSVYEMSDYVYSNEALDASYYVGIEQIDGNSTQVKVYNLWDGDEEVIMDVDLVNRTVSIASGQVIYVSNDHGDVKAWPFNGVSTTTTPITGTILENGQIRLNSWAATVAAGSFGFYKYSQLRPALHTFAGVYTEVDYLANGTVEATYENGVIISSHETDINKVLIKNFWNGGDFTIEAILNLDAEEFVIPPQIIYKHATYGDCYIYPYNVTDITIDKTGTPVEVEIEAEAGDISKTVFEVGSWAATVNAGTFGRYLKSTLTRGSAAAMRARFRPQYAMPVQPKAKSVMKFESFR